MSALNPLIAMQLVVPGDQDWIVRFRMRDGSVVARRVTPSTMTAETAIQKAISSLGSRRALVADYDCVRYADTRKLVIPAGQGGT